MKDILLLFAGGLITILVSILIEFLRRPRLTIDIAGPLDMPFLATQEMRSLRLIVRNEPLPRWASWMLRGAALQCRGAIIFRHCNDGQKVFGRTMEARWANAPEPIPIQVVGPLGKQLEIIDEARITSGSRIDIYPGEDEILDVAVRIDNDPNCYGWNNETYFLPDKNGRNPKWELPPGRYLVDVTVRSSGYQRSGLFRLVNDVARGDFRLDPASDEDRAKIRKFI